MKVNGRLLTKQQTLIQPVISFTPSKGRFYTIIMYDLNSPTPAYMHFMAVNVTNPSSIVSPLVPYEPPSPPVKDKHYHVYIFELYEQPGFLTFSPPLLRSGFNPKEFGTAHKLRKLAQRGFYMIPGLI